MSHQNVNPVAINSSAKALPIALLVQNHEAGRLPANHFTAAKDIVLHPDHFEPVVLQNVMLLPVAFGQMAKKTVWLSEDVELQQTLGIALNWISLER